MVDSTSESMNDWWSEEGKNGKRGAYRKGRRNGGCGSDDHVSFESGGVNRALLWRVFLFHALPLATVSSCHTELRSSIHGAQRMSFR